MDDFAMTVMEKGIVEIRLQNGDHVCRHKVRWDVFCRQVLLTDYLVRNGNDAFHALLKRCEAREICDETAC